MVVVREKCWICGAVADFCLKRDRAMKRHAACSNCGVMLRTSDTARVLLQVVLGNGSGCLQGAHKALRPLAIWNLSALGPIHETLKELPGYVGTEWLDGVPSGQSRDGILCADITKAPFADHAFDLVISEDVLEHVEYPDAAFREIGRILKPGGSHVFSVPVMEGKPTRSRVGKPVFRHGDPIRKEGVPVWMEFGDDLGEVVRKASGMETSRYPLHIFHTPDEVTDLDRDATQASAPDMIPERFYKFNGLIFVSRAPGVPKDLASGRDLNQERLGAALNSVWRFCRQNGVRLAVAKVKDAVGRGGVRGLVSQWRAVMRDESSIPMAPGDLHQARIEMRRRMKQAFDSWMRSDAILEFSESSSPRVTVLLVLWNQAELTLGCLQSLHRMNNGSLEVLIVDNASSDRTPELLARVRGVRVIRNEDNRGFLLAANQGARSARGNTLWFLNNDACVRPGCLDYLVEALDSDPAVGAVGGRVVLPNGALQEAGCMVWPDGSCLGYGRGQHPEAGDTMFRRDVDFCSGVCLLVRRDVFLGMGGFDEDFAPAYYEETDFCLRLRQNGLRVVYEPRAVVEHYEYGSATQQNEPSAQMRKNQALLLARHEALLSCRPAYSPGQILRARSVGVCRGRILYVDDRVPLCRLGSGFPRAQAIVRSLRDQGWFVTVFAAHGGEAWEDIRREVPVDVEVIMARSALSLRDWLATRRHLYDCLWVSRPTNMAAVTVLRKTEPGLLEGMKIVYDAEAVWATRDLSRAELQGHPKSSAEAGRMVREELELALNADTVVAVAPADASLFMKAGCRAVEVVSHAIEAAPTETPFEYRRGILFVGYLGVDDSPNVDAVEWFWKAIMPGLVQRAGGAIPFTVVGGDAVPRLRKLAQRNPGFMLVGAVEELTPWYEKARIFVAPTRFGAGVPLKVYEAAARGVPTVISSLLAKQTGWRHGVDCLVGEEADSFSLECSRLHEDRELWLSLRERALLRVNADCSRETMNGKIEAILGRS